MIAEQTKRRRVYFADVQRKWSVLQADAAQDMIDGLSRHGENADPLGELRQEPAQAA